LYYLLGVRQLTWKVQQPSISNVMKKWGGQTTALCSPYRNLGKKCRNTAAILREQLRQKMQKNYGKKSQNMCENCTYVVAIYKKIVFRDFCIRNTGRYKEVVGTAIFWHKIKARCFVLCVLGEFSAQNTLVLHNCIFFACQLPKIMIKVADFQLNLRKFVRRSKKLRKLTKNRGNLRVMAKIVNLQQKVKIVEK